MRVRERGEGAGEWERGGGGEAPRHRVFNIRLERIAQTGCALLSHANAPPPLLCMASRQPRDQQPPMTRNNEVDVAFIRQS